MLQCIESEGIILHFIDLEELLTNEFSIYAHKNGTERELLEEHIKRCEYYFKVIYDQKNLEYAVTQFGKPTNGILSKHNSCFKLAPLSKPYNSSTK